jgi:hypothetical protein
MQRKFFSALTISAILSLGTIALTACSNPQPDSTPAPIASPETISTENLWATLLAKTEMPLWKVEPCEGTAPFLCVYDEKGEQAGTVELQSWTLQQRPDLAEALVEVGLNPEAIDPQDPAQQEKLLTALKKLVDDFYTTIEQDWATGYRNAVTLEVDSPVEVSVGSQPALLYGFKGIESDGTLQQRSVGYMVFDGEKLYVITTAAAFEEPPGFKTIEQLQAFQPYLDIVVGKLRF